MKNLSQHWMRIQATLFPYLKEELGPVSEKQQQWVTALEFARIENFVRDYYGYVGAPAADRQALTRAFVAKTVYNISANSHFRERLLCDKVLRRICGFDSKREVYLSHHIVNNITPTSGENSIFVLVIRCFLDMRLFERKLGCQFAHF